MWENIEKIAGKISWPQIGKDFFAYLVPGVMFMVLGNYYGEHRVLKMDGLLFAEDGLGKWWKYLVLLIFAYVVGRVIYIIGEFLLTLMEAIKEKKIRQINWFGVVKRLFWDFKIGKRLFGAENTPVIENLLLTEIFAEHPEQEKVYARASIRYSFAVGVFSLSLVGIILLNPRFLFLAVLFLLIVLKEKVVLDETKNDLAKLMDKKIEVEQAAPENKNLKLEV